MDINTYKTEKDVILTLPNPEYRTLVQSYGYLRGVILIIILRQNYPSTLILSKQLLKDKDQHISWIDW